MVQKGLRVTNYHAIRRVRFVCGSTGNSLCANKTLYGEPVMETATDETTTTDVQIGALITNIANNKIYYKISTISFTTTETDNSTDTIISSTTTPETSYQFPSGYDSLGLWYSFTNTDTNEIFINNPNGAMSNSDATNMNNITSPITVTVGDAFTQKFTGSLSGINNWECNFPYYNYSYSGGTYNIFLIETYVYPS